MQNITIFNKSFIKTVLYSTPGFPSEMMHGFINKYEYEGDLPYFQYNLHACDDVDGGDGGDHGCDSFSDGFDYVHDNFWVVDQSLVLKHVLPSHLSSYHTKGTLHVVYMGWQHLGILQRLSSSQEGLL